MSIEPTPNRDDRLSRTHKASIVDTYIAESSVTVGDDAMIEVSLHRNNASERWLRLAIDRDDRLTEDIDSNEDDVEENEVAREESWTGDLMWESLLGPPRDLAEPGCSRQNLFLRCWLRTYSRLRERRRLQRRRRRLGPCLGRTTPSLSDCAAASLPLFLPHALDRTPLSVAIIGEMSHGKR